MLPNLKLTECLVSTHADHSVAVYLLSEAMQTNKYKHPSPTWEPTVRWTDRPFASVGLKGRVCSTPYGEKSSLSSETGVVQPSCSVLRGQFILAEVGQSGEEHGHLSARGRQLPEMIINYKFLQLSSGVDIWPSNSISHPTPSWEATSHTGVPGVSHDSAAELYLHANVQASWEAAGDSLGNWTPPAWRTYSWLPSSSWSSFHCCEYLGNEPMDRRSLVLSLYLSL